MNVLVLGGTGVISAQIVKLLIEKGHSVTTYHRGSDSALAGVTRIVGDTHDEDALRGTLRNARYDAVIDMLCFNPADAKRTMEVFGGKTDQIVICSSVAAYQRPYENQPVQPDNPLMTENVFQYGFDKAEMERYLQSWIHRGYPITIIRPSQTWWVGTTNVGALRTNYGLIERINAGKPVIVNGDGKNNWVWTFSPDLAKAFVGVLGKQCCLGESYHATSDEAHIWDDLYLTIGRIIGKTPILYHISTQMLYAANPDLFAHLLFEKTYCGLFDNTKIREHVPEFICTYTLEAGMRAIFDWYMSDSAARVVDKEKVLLEDSLCALYETWIRQLYALGTP